jgi:hypothetical protein
MYNFSHDPLVVETNGQRTAKSGAEFIMRSGGLSESRDVPARMTLRFVACNFHLLEYPDVLVHRDPTERM